MKKAIGEAQRPRLASSVAKRAFSKRTGTCGGTSKKPKTACGNIRGQLIGVLQGHDPPLLEKRLNEFRNPTGALVRH